jgi:deoxyribodipyrimidine photo-lyase
MTALPAGTISFIADGYCRFTEFRIYVDGGATQRATYGAQESWRESLCCICSHRTLKGINMRQYRLSIFCFRRDLRLSDNTALAEACAQSERVIPLFVFDGNILDRLDNVNDRRLTFIHDSLLELRTALRERSSDLVVLTGDPRREIPAYAKRVNADAVFINRDYEPYAAARDAAIHEALLEQGCSLSSHKDQVIFGTSDVLTVAGEAYRVYTPYSRAWRRRLDEAMTSKASPVAERTADLSRLAPASAIPLAGTLPSLDDLGFRRQPLWLKAGEMAAARRLQEFLPRMARYADERDFPALDATSGLSVHLRFGTISIRELLRHALSDSSDGARVWMNELVWREFYQMILHHYPHVVSGAFRKEYDGIIWPGREEHFHAWCEGRTGYPLVDAAMRHFNTTGWMHNRLRMVTAMFLSKDLLVDWRLGEAYFARHLLDYDLAANNGGWQWSASTGVDAAPYFRIFNPVLQSRRFDASGDFIREHLPELRTYSDKHIHWPHDADAAAQRAAGCIIGSRYPHPLVDHHVQKQKAVELFAGVKRGG